MFPFLSGSHLSLTELWCCRSPEVATVATTEMGDIGCLCVSDFSHYALRWHERNHLRGQWRCNTLLKKHKNRNGPFSFKAWDCDSVWTATQKQPLHITNVHTLRRAHGFCLTLQSHERGDNMAHLQKPWEPELPHCVNTAAKRADRKCKAPSDSFKCFMTCV